MNAKDTVIDILKYQDKPSITKLLTALTRPPLTYKWNSIGDEGVHLAILFQLFIDDEEVRSKICECPQIMIWYYLYTV